MTGLYRRLIFSGLLCAGIGGGLTACEYGGGMPGPVPYAPMMSAPAMTGSFVPAAPHPASRERFAEVTPSTWQRTAEAPVSTFGADVDTASYAVLRRMVREGRRPPADAVRVEEMINYFSYAYPAPAGRAQPFTVTPTVLPSPWKPGARLLHVAVKGWQQPAATRPAAHLTFLIDVSGSMDAEDRLPLIRRALHLLVDGLRPDDRVAIVTYAGQAGVRLAPTPVAERAAITSAIDSLQASGGTAGGDGLRTAYALAAASFAKNGINRVILATDGDFNIGETNPRILENLIAEQRRKGIYLSVVGVGLGNLNDSLMQRLSQTGNGQAAYLDSLQEARRIWLDALESSLVPIADDLKIQVEFNPAQVAEYRLIGYETRALRRADFNDDTVDAGDIGSGHTVTAIYEYLPVGAGNQAIDPLRYGPTPVPGADRGEIAFIKLRYKAPRAANSSLITRRVLAGATLPKLAAASDDIRFAVAIAGYGQLLRGQLSADHWSSTIALADAARGPDPHGWRAEAVQLMRLATTLGR